MTRMLKLDLPRNRYFVIDNEDQVITAADWLSLPPASNVFDYAPADVRRKIRRRSSLSWYTLREKMEPMEIAQMLASYVSSIESRPPTTPREEENPGVYTIPMDPVQYSPSYLTLGHAVYRLQQVELQDRPSSALRAVRRTVRESLETVQRNAVTIQQRAEQRARNTIADAERRANTMNDQRLIVPYDIASVEEVSFNLSPHNDRHMLLLVKETLPVKEYAYGDRVWQALDTEQPPWFCVCFEIDAQKSVLWRSVRMDSLFQGCHPHISSTAACLTPGESLTIDFTSVDLFKHSIHKARSILRRVMYRINLSSLLVAPLEWNDYYIKSLPETLRGLELCTTPIAASNFASAATGYTVVEEGSAWLVAR